MGTTKTVIRTEIMDITGSMSGRWLEENSTNYRVMRERHVDFLIEQLKAGWELNGESIKFDPNMVLVDGRHRLTACYRSGIPFRSVVVFGVTDYSNIDVGLNRRFSDYVRRIGMPHAAQVSGAVSKIMALESDNPANFRAHVPFRRMEDVLRRYPKLEEIVRMALKARPVESPNRAAAIIAVSAGRVEGFGEFFVNGLHDGVGLKKRDPVLQLRQRLISNKIHRTKMTWSHRMAIAVKAWNAMLLGQSVYNLRWREVGPTAEDFPKLIKLRSAKVNVSELQAR